MKTEWDYSNYAKAYLKRPDYSDTAIDEMLQYTGITKGAKICDIGAGVAHLSIALVQRGSVVYAVEPNDEMRKFGIQRTRGMENIIWFEGVGENTRQEDSFFDMVTFGSSFNVCDRAKTLIETSRILKPGNHFACMWNHRDLEDSIQQNIENIIKKNILDYSYGTRREDPTDVIVNSGLFTDVKRIEGRVIHKQSVKDCIKAWYSHATLGRQAKNNFKKILNEIELYLCGLDTAEIEIPYTTNIWIAKCKKNA